MERFIGKDGKYAFRFTDEEVEQIEKEEEKNMPVIMQVTKKTEKEIKAEKAAAKKVKKEEKIKEEAEIKDKAEAIKNKQ